MRGDMKVSVSAFMVLLLLAGLNYIPTRGIAEDEPPLRQSEVTFTNVTQQVGLSGLGGNFFSWGDYDHDSYQDLLINGKRLFRNRGPPAYDFVEVTEEAGISRPVNSGVFADFDNDGWVDLFCGGGSGSSDHPGTEDVLWRNNGDGTFTDYTDEAGGLKDTFPTVAAGWGDANRDGYPDLYMANYENRSLVGYPDYFWLNNGDGTFTNMTEDYGMDESDDPYPGRGVSWCDFNNDGWQDLYVSNYRIKRNYLYMNDKGSGMLEMGEEKRVEGHGNNHPVTREGPYYGHSVGSVWADFDNDLDMDLWVTNLAHKDPWRGPICDDSYLFENLGEEENYTFEDVREGSGIPLKSIPGAIGGGDELMVSCASADYDNDGDTDLFIPQIYNDLSYAHSYLYSNEGDMTFSDGTSVSGLKVWNTYGSAWCDYNEDGWVDLITGGGVWDEEQGETVHREVHLFENNGYAESDNHWIQVDLLGRESGTSTIGARVEVSSDSDGDGDYDLDQVRELQAGTAAHGQQDSHILHFGLGENEGPVSIRVIWPMGREVRVDVPEIDKRIRLFEPTEEIRVNLSVGDLRDTEEGLMADIILHNDSPYPLHDRMIAVEISGRDPVEIVKRDEVSPYGDDLIPLTFPGVTMDSLYGEEMRVCLEWSYPMSRSSGCLKEIVEEENQPPVPVLEGPQDTFAGEEVTFSGEGSYDPEGDELEYLFYFGDGETTGWVSNPLSKHVYDSPDTYRARLYVRDQKGLESLGYSELEVRVDESEGKKPIARIISVKPSPAFQGDEVSFMGEGDPFSGEYITRYMWESDLDGRLSSRKEFVTDDLSPGTHTIEFTVRDSNGLWSDPDIWRLEVEPHPEIDLWVEIDTTDIPSVVESDFTLEGEAGPGEVVSAVQVKVGPRDWESAWSLPEWEYRVNIHGLDPGELDVVVRSTDGFEFSDYSHVTINISGDEDDSLGASDLRDSPDIGENAGLIIIIGIPLIVTLCLLSFLIAYGIVSKKRSVGK